MHKLHTEFKEFLLPNPPSILSAPEELVIGEVFCNPTVIKYLNTLLWNAIRDLASIPITDIPDEEYKIRHAYVKGNIGVLTTMLSISSSKPELKG